MNTAAVPTFATGGAAVCGGGKLPVVLPLPAGRLGLWHLVVGHLGWVSALRPLAGPTVVVSHTLAVNRVP